MDIGGAIGQARTIPLDDVGAYGVGAFVADLRVSSDAERLRLVFEFVARWNEMPGHLQAPLAMQDPGMVSRHEGERGRRWDALVAGVVEHLCWHSGIEPPGWVAESDRFLDDLWWPVDLPVARAWALTEAPASLLRRGVVLSRTDLDRV